MIWLPAYAFLALYALWLLYLAVMNLQRARDAGTLSRPARCLGLPLLYCGLLVDFLVNVLVLTVLLLEWPREWLVTARLSRHIKDAPGWRRSVSAWICSNLLDSFDPSGCHCK
ncbi:hypothetical protein AAKU55_002494 [Oxalobacteraceae bacterium GrIS 1.11]